MENDSFLKWLQFCANQARYNRDAYDSKAADILENVIVRYQQSAALRPSSDQPGGERERAIRECAARVASLRQGWAGHDRESAYGACEEAILALLPGSGGR